MNKTVSVSIGGFAFILEEDAYRRLEQYLEKVKLNLGSSEDTDEIISDVEGRMAELLTEYLSSAGRQVLDAAMVEKAIVVMGAPEDFNITGEPVKENAEPEAEDRSAYRALYRETEDRYLGGVCAGLAHYLGWDPLAVRLIFLALLFGFGSGVIVYIIMWILVPPANTTAEKLRMHGKPVNLESIKGRFETFSDEVKQLGKNIKKNKWDWKWEWKKKGTPLGKRFEDSVYEIGRVFATLIGVFLLLLGVLLCFALFTQLFGGQSFLSTDDHFLAMVFQDPTLVFERSSDFSFLYWGIFTLIFLFTINLFRAGIRLLFKLPLKNRMLKRASVVVSVLAIASTIYGGIRLGKQFTNDESLMNKPFESASDTLYISVDHDEEFSDKFIADKADYEELVKIKDRKLVFGYPQLDIRRSESSTSRMEVERSACGPGKLEAIRYAENIFYPVDTSGDSIRLKPVFTAPLADKFRAQEVKIRLLIPIGTVVFVNEGSFRVLRLENSETNEKFWEGSPYSAKGFVMEKNGLRAL